MLPVCLALCLDLPQISSAFLCLLSIWVYRGRTGSRCHHLLPTPCCSSYFSSQASDLSLIWIFWPHTKTCRSSFPHIYTMFLSQAEGTPHAWWLRGLGLVLCDPPVGPTGYWGGWEVWPLSQEHCNLCFHGSRSQQPCQLLSLLPRTTGAALYFWSSGANFGSSSAGDVAVISFLCSQGTIPVCRGCSLHSSGTPSHQPLLFFSPYRLGVELLESSMEGPGSSV